MRSSDPFSGMTLQLCVVNKKSFLLTCLKNCVYIYILKTADGYFSAIFAVRSNTIMCLLIRKTLNRGVTIVNYTSQYD